MAKTIVILILGGIPRAGQGAAPATGEDNEEARVSSVNYTLYIGRIADDSDLDPLAWDLESRKPPYRGFVSAKTEEDPTAWRLRQEMGERLERRVELALLAEQLSEETFTPAALQIDGRGASQLWTKKDSNGNLRQILTDSYLVDVSVQGPGSFSFTTYYRPSIGKLNPDTGLYDIPEDADIYRNIRVMPRNPEDPQRFDLRSLSYPENQKPPSIQRFVWDFKKTATGESVRLSSYRENRQTGELTLEEDDLIEKTSPEPGVTQVHDAEWQVTPEGREVGKSVEDEKYIDLGQGMERYLVRVRSPGTSFETKTAWTYSDLTGTGVVGPDGVIKPPVPGAPVNLYTGARVLSQRDSDGDWQEFSYQFDEGTKTLTIQKWEASGNIPFGDRAKASHTVVTLEENKRVVVEKLGGRTYSTTKELVIRDKDQVSLREEIFRDGDAKPEVTEVGYYGCHLPEPRKGRIKYRRNPDGSMVRYDYAKANAGMKTTVEEGFAGDGPYDPSATGAVENLTKGKRTQRLLDRYKRVKAERIFDIATGDLLEAKE